MSIYDETIKKYDGPGAIAFIHDFLEHCPEITQECIMSMNEITFTNKARNVSIVIRRKPHTMDITWKNSSFTIDVVGKTIAETLTFLFDLLDYNPFEAHGFCLTHTGGGCMAYQMDRPRRIDYVLITQGEDGILEPRSPLDKIMVGTYDLVTGCPITEPYVTDNFFHLINSTVYYLEL